MPFIDAGLNRITLTGQLRENTDRVPLLNSFFPQAGFDGHVKIAPGTQLIRVSSGVELQFRLPVVQAPFRVYYALNPSVVREWIITPIVADRTIFPNSATFTDNLGLFAGTYPMFERRNTFRVTISKTF